MGLPQRPGGAFGSSDEGMQNCRKDLSNLSSIDFACLVQMSKGIVTGALLLARPLKGGEPQKEARRCAV